MALVDGQELADVLDLDYATYDDALDQVADAANYIVRALITNTAYLAEHPALKEAALSVGAEMWQARTASGGQAVSVDFTPGPYRLSVWLTRRVNALIGPYMNVNGMVG